MKQITSNKKFIQGEIDYIEDVLKEDKSNNDKIIPYYFGCFESTPQYIVLCYIFKNFDIEREYIKVKPEGLFFHGKYYTNLPLLIRFFKTSFHKQDYQNYARRVKPPILNIGIGN